MAISRFTGEPWPIYRGGPASVAVRIFGRNEAMGVAAQLVTSEQIEAYRRDGAACLRGIFADWVMVSFSTRDTPLRSFLFPSGSSSSRVKVPAL